MIDADLRRRIAVWLCDRLPLGFDYAVCELLTGHEYEVDFEASGVQLVTCACCDRGDLWIVHASETIDGFGPP